VLSPRTLRELYNPRVIVEAFRRLSEQVPDAQLVLKHMGTDAPDVGELPPGVRVIGHVPYEEMADWYRAADACVSIASSDSSPRSVWEAMACECPCVVSDLPWVHETIEPGRHALVCEIAPEPVAAALESLVTDAELTKRIRAAGRALVEAERDQAAEMRRLADIYRELSGVSYRAG
jgi:glycosyltransferase involved in cell wall biosynthesis